MVHLRKAGIKGSQLLRLYNVFVRPVIEFCCVVYHPLLTKGQSEDIERLQKQVIKLAFGWDLSYTDMCSIYSIPTLEERRKDYIDRFILKTIDSERFSSSWFPLRENIDQDVRDRRPFCETRARTARYFNSPLSFMKRRANELYIEAEA